MHTPQSAFKEMCPNHGEIWNISEKGWRCIRKDLAGNRYIDESKTIPPLDVVDMLKATGLTWAYYIGCLDIVVPLVSKHEKAKLVQEHSLTQIVAEGIRRRNLRKDIRDDVSHAVDEFSEKMGFGVNIKPGSTKPEDMN